MPARNNNTRRKLLSIIIPVIIFDLIFLYFIKYRNQGLPISDFDILYPGNFFNLFFAFILILGIVFYSYNKKIEYKPRLLIFYTVLMTAALVLSEIYSLVKIPLPNIFILDHPLREVLQGILFSVYQFIQFIFISVVWITLSGRKDLLLLRATVNSVAIVIFLFITAFITLQSGAENKLKSKDKNKRKFTGVVLGAAVWSGNQPSPSLAFRADKAAELYQQKILKRIQLTGGHAPGEMSEAEVAYKYLKEKNIDTTNIRLEKKTSSTNEQIRFIKNELIDNQHLHNIVIISDSYHLTRVQEICKFYHIKAKVAASGLNLSFDNKIYYRMKESIALLVFWFFAL